MGVLGLSLICFTIATAVQGSFIVKRSISTRKGYGISPPPPVIPNAPPIISSFHINSNIEFRYASTSVESHVKNPGSTAQEISFTAIIPNSAFISNFIMVIDGVEFVAEVAAKEKAKKAYDEAVVDGRGAGLVAQDVRDSNKFTVSANVEPAAKVVFKLMYEELLQRKLGWYEHVINVNPGQIVDNLSIKVNIDESRPLAKLSMPEMKQSNAIDFEPGQENRIAQVEWEKGNATARIEFEPTKEQQEEYGEQGLSGQLIIKYDVERDDMDNEVQVIDGYFVHFFTPENLRTLPKHVIFVLDISGSMSGDKIIQLKDAMFTILDDMTEKDYFNIITFSSSFHHWKLPSKYVSKLELIQATDNNRKEAIKFTNSINANGGTNINAGLLEGLKLAAEARKNEALPTNLQSIVVFLSDGEPTEGVTNGNDIRENVRKANHQLKVPIYSLGFGRGADFNLIREISTDADAFSKHIYEDSDAALQLVDFFAEISSPLLSNLNFNYVGGLVDNSSISLSHLPTFYKGGEFVVAGKLMETPAEENDILEVTISAAGESGTVYDHKSSICLRPCSLPRKNNKTAVNNIHYIAPDYPLENTCPLFCSPPSPPPPRSKHQNFLQKLHAFLNIKQLLRSNKVVNGTKSSNEKALQLSLSNNFVTELTSLIVTRPNETAKISSVSEAKVSKSYRSNYRGFQHSKPMPRNSAPLPRPTFRTTTASGYDHNQIYKFSYSADIGYDYDYSNTGFSVTEAVIPRNRAGPRCRRHFVWNSYRKRCVRTRGNRYSGGVQSRRVTTTTAAPCFGNLTMFSKTYYRGENVTVTDDRIQLGDFDDKVVSIHVKGDCCWSLWSLVGFQGDQKIFKEGHYRSTHNVGKMFREASSVQKIMYC